MTKGLAPIPGGDAAVYRCVEERPQRLGEEPRLLAVQEDRQQPGHLDDRGHAWLHRHDSLAGQMPLARRRSCQPSIAGCVGWIQKLVTLYLTVWPSVETTSMP
jgi:hypothetical protein